MDHSVEPVAPERVLFVHAHPDDETISTGGTLALMASSGADVAVLTCTRGELGEVIPPSLKHLEGDAVALAAYRERELATALDALGVEQRLFLGEHGARAAGLSPRRYADSGMVWGADGRPRAVSDVQPHSLCAASFDEVVADLLAAIETVGADAIVSYDEDGGYGHPDHVLAHRAARSAADRAGLPFHVIIEDADELERLEASAVPHDGVTLLDVSPVLTAKVAALRAHATQVTVLDEPGGAVRFALSSGPSRPVATREGFRLLEAPAPDDATAEAPETGDPRAETRSSRIAAALVALIVGILVGILLTINHQQQVSIAGSAVPVGLVGGLILVTALLIGMRLVFASRVVALFAAIGVVGATMLLSQEGPGGSVLVPANAAGFVWAYGPMIIAAVVLAWPRVAPPRRSRMEVQSRQEGPAS